MAYEDYLNAISTARYGREVRSSIVNALRDCYTYVKGDTTPVIRGFVDVTTFADSKLANAQPNSVYYIHGNATDIPFNGDTTGINSYAIFCWIGGGHIGDAQLYISDQVVAKRTFEQTSSGNTWGSWSVVSDQKSAYLHQVYTVDDSDYSYLFDSTNIESNSMWDLQSDVLGKHIRATSINSAGLRRVMTPVLVRAGYSINVGNIDYLHSYMSYMDGSHRFTFYNWALALDGQYRGIGGVDRGSMDHDMLLWITLGASSDNISSKKPVLVTSRDRKIGSYSNISDATIDNLAVDFFDIAKSDSVERPSKHVINIKTEKNNSGVFFLIPSWINSGQYVFNIDVNTDIVGAGGNIQVLVSYRKSADVQNGQYNKWYYDGYLKGITLDNSNQLRTIKFNTVADFDNLAVYKDAVGPYRIMVQHSGDNNTGRMNIVIREAHVQSSIANLDIYSNTFDGLIANIDKKISTKADSSNQVFTSPNGTRYLLNVANDGSVSTTPVVPNKTVFIGNSLLLGMGKYGMCASSPRNDYAYYVSQAILAKNSKATFSKLHCGSWEQPTDTHSEAQWFEGNKANIPQDADLIVLQVGDNVNNDAKEDLFRQTLPTTITRIRTWCPKARIIVMGWWYNASRVRDTWKNACNQFGMELLEITDLNIKANQGYSGQKYELDDGTTGVVKDTWITHPGNTGHKLIADRLIKQIGL